MRRITQSTGWIRRQLEASDPEYVQRREFDLFVDEYALERLRTQLRHELRTHQGQRALAAEIGIDRGSLRKFVEMRSIPTADRLEAVEDWVGDRPDLHTPIQAVCLAILVLEFPASARALVRAELARVLDIHYRDRRRPAPWLHRELLPLRHHQNTVREDE